MSSVLRRLKCALGFHCWHSVSRERGDFRTWDGIHLRDYRATRQRCCECGNTRVIL